MSPYAWAIVATTAIGALLFATVLVAAALRVWRDDRKARRPLTYDGVRAKHEAKRRALRYMLHEADRRRLGHGREVA